MGGNAGQYSPPGHRRWAAAAKYLMWAGVACFVVATSTYYWPDVTTAAHPESGHVYGVRNHYSIVYWTRTELLLNRNLTIVAGVLFLAGFILAVRVRAARLSRR